METSLLPEWKKNVATAVQAEILSRRPGETTGKPV
jgi:hypothetical protein